MVKAFTRVHRGAVDRTPKYPFSGMCLQLSPVVTQPLRSQTYTSVVLLLVFLVAASACPGNAVSNRLCIDTAYAQIEADGVRLQTRLASSCTLLDKVACRRARQSLGVEGDANVLPWSVNHDSDNGQDLSEHYVANPFEPALVCT